MANGFCVYIHRFSNGTIYIGKGRKNRAFQMNSSRRNIHWNRIHKKYGDPRVRVVVKNTSESDALCIERSLINLATSKGKSTCNIAYSENNPNITEEGRLKMSQSRLGDKNPNYGNVMSEDSRGKISKANKGRHLGRKSPRYKVELFEFKHKDGRVICCTMAEFINITGAHQSSASSLCSGKRMSTKGWRLSCTSESSTGSKGANHGRYDKTIFNFIHKSGVIESCTKYELYTKYSLPHPSNLASVCNGKIKSYKGWRLAQG